MRTRVYKRWFSVGGTCRDPWRATLRQCQKLKMSMLGGGKPGWVAWYGIAMRCTSAQMAALEAWWDSKKIRRFNRRPRGAFEVDQGDVIPWETIWSNI